MSETLITNQPNEIRQRGLYIEGDADKRLRGEEPHYYMCV